MSKHAPEISRRQFLAWAGAGATSVVVPRMAAAQSDRKVTILQGSGSVLLSWAPSFLAEDMGFYKEEGLAVERVFNGSGPAGMTALVGGSGTVLLNPPGEPLSAAARGQKFRFLMAQSNYQASQFIISKEYAAKHGLKDDTPIERKVATAKNFKGIKVGMTSPGSLSDHAARAVLKGVGLGATDAEILPLGTVPNAMAAMSRGALDAISGASPAGEIAQSQHGAVILFSTEMGGIPKWKALSGHLMIARASGVETNPDLYATLVRADTRALRHIVEDPKAAGEMLHKTRYASMSKEVWSLVWERNLFQFRSPYVSKESIEAWVTMGVMPTSIDLKAVDINTMVDMRFVNQAVQKIGWKVRA